MAVICHVTEAFAGGVFASVVQLCNGLAARGHTVHLFYSTRQHTPADVAAYLHPDIVLQLHQFHREVNPLSDIRAVQWLRRQIQELRPDVLHLHSSKAGAIGRAAAVGYLRGRRVFYSPHGLSFLRKDISRFRAGSFFCFEWVLARFPGQLVACSNGEATELDRLRHAGVFLIENAVETRNIVPKRRRRDNEILVGTAGRICPQKAPDMFASVARSLRRRGRFIWIGDGDASEREKLEASGVKVTGWVSRGYCLDVISTLDIYLQTSLWEGMPVSVIEAQCAGIPVVVTDCVGNRDVVDDGETGYIVDSRAECLEYVELLADSPDLRMRLGGNARERGLCRFSLARQIDEVERLYGV